MLILKISHTHTRDIKTKAQDVLQKLIDDISESDKSSEEWAKNAVADLAVIMLDIKTSQDDATEEDTEE